MYSGNSRKKGSKGRGTVAVEDADQIWRHSETKIGGVSLNPTEDTETPKRGAIAPRPAWVLSSL